MKKVALLFVLMMCFGVNTIYAQTIDSEKSIVNFKIGNMKISHVKGTFTGMKGSVVFSPENVANAKFNVCIDASTIQTGIKKRDHHLKTEDFFDVEKYPNICFNSTSVEKKDDSYITKGDLILHGITKKVEIPFTYENKVLTGNFIINRLDYNVGGSGTFAISDEVEIEIKCYLK